MGPEAIRVTMEQSLLQGQGTDNWDAGRHQCYVLWDGLL